MAVAERWKSDQPVSAPDSSLASSSTRYRGPGRPGFDRLFEQICKPTTLVNTLEHYRRRLEYWKVKALQVEALANTLATAMKERCEVDGDAAWAPSEKSLHAMTKAEEIVRGRASVDKRLSDDLCVWKSADFNHDQEMACFAVQYVWKTRDRVKEELDRVERLLGLLKAPITG